MKTEANDSVQVTFYSKGLTKREYFAALILQGIFSDHKSIDTLGRMKITPEQVAVKQADLLITELNKEQK